MRRRPTAVAGRVRRLICATSGRCRSPRGPGAILPAAARCLLVHWSTATPRARSDARGQDPHPPHSQAIAMCSIMRGCVEVAGEDVSPARRFVSAGVHLAQAAKHVAKNAHVPGGIVRQVNDPTALECRRPTARRPRSRNNAPCVRQADGRSTPPGQDRGCLLGAFFAWVHTYCMPRASAIRRHFSVRASSAGRIDFLEADASGSDLRIAPRSAPRRPRWRGCSGHSFSPVRSARRTPAPATCHVPPAARVELERAIFVARGSPDRARKAEHLLQSTEGKPSHRPKADLIWDRRWTRGKKNP